MKSKYSSFLPLFSIVVTVGLSPLHAATVDTTATTVVLNTDAPGNQYIGNGILQVSADANNIISLGTSAGSPNTQFYMTAGGLITIDTGVTLLNGGWSKGSWINGSTPNKADMTVNGTLDLWDGNPVYVNALNGAGAVTVGIGNAGTRQLNIGTNDGGGTFSGTTSTATGSSIRINKNGTGTQIFNNLTNQKPNEIYLNAGVVELSEAGTSTMATNFYGVGKLTKSGAGSLTLSGTLAHTGVTTVSDGTLSVGTNLYGAKLAIASTAVVNLNFSGRITVDSLDVAGSGPLLPGLYNSINYPSNLSGSGTLRIVGPVPSNNGTWTSLVNEFWSEDTCWQGNTIASGAGNTATFNAPTGVTVTLDANYTMGHLAFDVSDYTIAGTKTLTLAATSPSVTVTSGRTATISSIIAGTAGLTKLDAGLLTLSGANSYTGGTTVSGGRLKLVNNKTGSSTFATNAELEFNLTSGDQRLNGGTISGTGNLIKSGGSQLLLGAGGSGQTVALTDAASIIDVQGGTLRNDFGNSAWGSNKAGLKVVGATFDIWDGNATVDEVNGSGTINKGFAGANTLTIGVNNGSGTFSGTITNTSGTMSLVKKGSGTQTLTGSNTYSGTTTISAGILSLGNILAMQNSTLDTTNSITGDATNGLQTTVSSLTLGGLTGNKDLASVFTTSSGGYNALTALTLNMGTGSYRSYTGVIAEGAAGMTLTKTGLGALSLAGANTYAGATTVSGGVLALQKSATGSINVAASAGLGLVVGGTGGYTLADVDALFAGTLSGVTMTPTSLVGIDTSLGDLIYSSTPVTTRGFAKTGLNTLTLDGNNAAAFGGGTTVYAGVLSLANTAAKPLGTVTANAGAGVALAVGGAGYFTTANVDSLWAGSLSGVTLSAASLVGIDTTQGDLSYTTPTTPLTRGLAKVGSNKLTLTGANAYTGGTLVGAGKLVLMDTLTGSPNFVTNADLEFQITTGNLTLSKNGKISGSGNLIKTGAGALLLGFWDGSETIALTGADSIIDVQGGTLRNDYGNSAWGDNKAGLKVVGATFDIWDGNATVDEVNGSGTINKGWSGGHTLTIGVNNGSGTFSGTIGNSSGTMSLIKQGSGTQTLSGTCSYGGGTTINGGTLALGNNNILPGTAVSIGNATLDTATFTDTVGTLDVTAAAKINLGSGGALVFANSNGVDWTGGTLNITGNFVSGSSIKFATSAGLSSTQLDAISLNGNSSVDCTLDGNGYLVINLISDPYADWATGNETFDGDANGDGVQDGLAWFLGAATPATNALDKLPKPANDGSFLTLDFQRVNPYAPAKLFVEFGNDLSGWTVAEIPASSGTISGNVVVEVTGTSPEDVKVKIPTSYQSASGALFARLRATNN